MNLGETSDGVWFKLKRLLFLTVYLFVIYGVLEGASYLTLMALPESGRWSNSQSLALIEKFPAQLRLSGEEIRDMFSDALPVDRFGQHLSFIYDPVIGYRSPNPPEWYGYKQGEIGEKFVILCFGGSTTEGDNWPRYLTEYARALNISDRLVVINAGVGGYMTFTEKLYFSEWIWPELSERGIEPDLVLTMDGVNDIWYRILSYQFSQKEKSPIWFNHYHGYHQKLSSDIRKLGALSNSLVQLTHNLLLILKNEAIVFLPYTMKLVESFAKVIIIDVAPKRYSITSNATDPEIQDLPEIIEDKVVWAYENSLLDFYSLVDVRSINFVSYLQPVLLEQYYPHQLPNTLEYSGINWFGKKLTDSISSFSNLYDSGIVRTDRMFKMSEGVYLTLGKQFPGHFESLIDLFKDDPNVETLYDTDGVHYEQKGKRKIAQAIVKDLLKKKILRVESP